LEGLPEYWFPGTHLGGTRGSKTESPVGIPEACVSVMALALTR
jgi:hypothetical protein